MISQTEQIFQSLELCTSINDIRVYQVENETLRNSLNKLQNSFQGLYTYYQDQTTIEHMIKDSIVQKAVKEIKENWEVGSRSEALRDKLIELLNSHEIDYEIFPDTKVTDQLLEVIN